MVEVSSDVIDKIIKIVKDGGGKVFEQDGYINFCGVRNNVTDNTFNDTLYIYWKDNTTGTFKCVKTSGFTTKPGKTVIQNSNNNTVHSGAAILKEGWQENIWKIGLHKKEYKALQSSGCNDTIITRDNTQFGKTGDYELRIIENTTEAGLFGINLHKSGDSQSTYVNGWSAGCQVFQYKNEFDEMLKMADYANSKGQTKFSYFLTNKKIFDNYGVVDNSGGSSYNFEQSQFKGYNPSSENTSVYPPTTVSNLGSYDSMINSEISSPSEGYSESNVEFSYSFLSFGLDRIFGDVFPNDDNNRYINMTSNDNAIIQYTEPKIKLSDIFISNKNYAVMGVMPDNISFYTPVVFINDFMIPQTNITNFCLDYSSFVPQVMVEFVDITNELLSTNIPKPGSYIKVLVGGYGDENYYKPIRQDFVITNINKTNKTGGDYQNRPHSRNPLKYKINGVLNVPMGLRKMGWSSSKINARQAIFNLSTMMGLGFATNFDIYNDIDKMCWVNTQSKSLYDFAREITQHSCYSPYTFFTSFIDQYYVLNYVECHSLLSHGGDKTESPQMIYNCVMPEVEKPKTENIDENMNSGTQKVSYYFLTNNAKFKGWTNYIEEYYELNDNFSMMSDGYRKHLSYSDKCGFLNLSSKNYKFLISPIDNLMRDTNRMILPLPEEMNQDTYIPLNLIHTTNQSYIDNVYVWDNPSSVESVIDMGEVDTSNTYPLYYYASAQNDFQMKSLKKCGLSVRLQNYNPSITKYSRIWVDIYDMNDNSTTQIRKNTTIDNMQESEAKRYLKEKNDNIITYENEMVEDNMYQVYNRSLSGWYVVTEMKISYNTVKDFKGVTYKKLQTQLILNRIEYKPTFHSEYELAKISIDKYRFDNVGENIMGSGDIM